MIDPSRMTKYKLTTNELEETILFSVCVAGHNAMTTAKALEKFLLSIDWKPNHKKWKQNSPFECIRRFDSLPGPGVTWNGLELHLKAAGLGCFRARAKTFRQLVSRDINLATCTPQELEAITGIGEKTSRFFILHTRKNARVAAIDTHMLKYLRAVGVGDVPDKSPKGATYLRLEKQFIELADKSGMSIADFDLMIWNFYAGHSPEIKWVWPNKSQCIA